MPSFYPWCHVTILAKCGHTCSQQCSQLFHIWRKQSIFCHLMSPQIPEIIYEYNISSFYIQNFKPLASFCSSAGWFVSYLVANPEDRFSRDKAHTCMYIQVMSRGFTIQVYVLYKVGNTKIRNKRNWLYWFKICFLILIFAFQIFCKQLHMFHSGNVFSIRPTSKLFSLTRLYQKEKGRSVVEIFFFFIEIFLLCF